MKTSAHTTKQRDIPGFDRQYMLEVACNREERLLEMAALFMEQSQKELLLLEQMIGRSDLTGAVYAIRSLKSTVSYMGFFNSIGQQLHQLELQLCNNTNSPTDRMLLLDEIRSDTQKARAFIQKQFLKNQT